MSQWQRAYWNKHVGSDIYTNRKKELRLWEIYFIYTIRCLKDIFSCHHIGFLTIWTKDKLGHCIYCGFEDEIALSNQLREIFWFIFYRFIQYIDEWFLANVYHFFIDSTILVGRKLKGSSLMLTFTALLLCSFAI